MKVGEGARGHGKLWELWGTLLAWNIDRQMIQIFRIS